MAVDFELAGRGVDWILLGVFAEILEGNVAVIVAHVALHLIHAALHELRVFELAILRRALDTECLNVVVGDFHGILFGFSVSVDNLHRGEHVEELLLRVERIDVFLLQTELLAELAGDILVRFAFEQRVDDALVCLYHFAIALVNEVAADKAMGAFPFCGNGEHDVRVPGRRCVELRVAYDHIDLAESLDALRHANVGLQLIAAVAVNDVDVDVALLGGIVVARAGELIVAAQDRIPNLVAVDGIVNGVLNFGKAVFAVRDQRIAAIARRAVHGRASHVARFAHMAAHGANRHYELWQAVHVVHAGIRCGAQEGDLVLLTHGNCEFANRIGVDAANLACPFGRFRRAVIGAHDVVFEVLIILGIGRHVVGVETDRALVQEVPIDDTFLVVLLEHCVRQAEHEGHVGCGANRQPFRVERCGAFAIHWVDVDELGASLFGFKVVEHLTAGGRPCGIHCHHHDGLAIAQIVAVVNGLVRRFVYIEANNVGAFVP